MKIFNKLKQIKSRIANYHAVIKSVSRDKGGYFSIAFDLIYCKLRFKATGEEYLKYQFYNYKNRYRKNYILDSDRKKYRNVVTPGFTYSKYHFYKRIPDLFSREMIVAPYCGEERFIAFLKKHKRIIVKPDTGSAGKGVEALEYTDDLAAKQYFDTTTIEEPMICEEFIRQHDVLNQLNPHSVNSIRLVSLLHDNEIKILSATLKIGAGDGITDNLSRGGIGAQVDVDTGIVTTYGKDFEKNSYTHHPVTGKQIIGLQIPNWDMAISTVKSAHKRLPQCLLYGWDIAITENGVDIVEANNKPGCRIMQVADGVPKGELLIPMLKKDMLKNERPNMKFSLNYLDE